MNRSEDQSNNAAGAGGTQNEYEGFEKGVMYALSAIVSVIKSLPGIDEHAVVHSLFFELPAHREATSAEERKVYQFLADQLDHPYVP